MSRERLDVDVYFVGDDDEVTAIFAGTEGEERPGAFTAYAHRGQHTTASVEWVNARRPAAAAEYADLLGELNQVGYNVTVVARP